MQGSQVHTNPVRTCLTQQSLATRIAAFVATVAVLGVTFQANPPAGVGVVEE